MARERSTRNRETAPVDGGGAANGDHDAAAVGERGRAIRSRRGLSRRTLAVHADTPERHRSRVESGRADVSVGVPGRIGGLDVAVGALLPSDPAHQHHNVPLWRRLEVLALDERRTAKRLLETRLQAADLARHGVVPGGSRGAGKITLGRLRAGRFGVPFVAVSDAIALISGIDVGELVSLAVQRACRRIERRALQQTIPGYSRADVETAEKYCLKINSCER